MRELAESRRDGAGEVVVRQDQRDDAALRVDLDAVPLPERRVRQRVPAGAPVRAPGGMVEDRQDVAIRRGRTLHTRSLMHGNGVQPRADGGVGWSAEPRAGIAELPERQCRERRRQPSRERIAADLEAPYRVQMAQLDVQIAG